MAVKRTRKQKEQATLRRMEQQFSLAEVEGTSDPILSGAAPVKPATVNLFGYSLRYIAQDLFKTIVVAGIVLALLVVLVVADLR